MNLYPTIQIEAWAHLLRAHKTLLESVQRDLSEARLPLLEWYDVLLELKQAPDQRMRFYELGQAIILSRSNLSRLCDRLERAGFLRRDDCADDRRGLYAVLTPEGLAMQKKMWPIYRASIERHFGSTLREKDAHSLIELLIKIRKTA